MADHLFMADKTQQPFEKVHVCRYGCNLHNPVVVDNKVDYLAEVNYPFRSGGTDFNPCFNYIMNQVSNAPHGSSFFIIFLTDGDGSYDTREQMKEALAVASQDYGISTTMYSLGFSEYHDANLLNYITQAGSDQGNFIYIDFNSPTPMET